jgi:hypothetical protein
VKRTLELDEQGRRDLEEEVRRLNARASEIEEESANRSGRQLTSPVVRVFTRPATAKEIADMKAEAAREEGTPPH